MSITGPEEIREADFIEQYGTAPVSLGDREVTLSTALQMEAAFCPADSTKRQDPAKRLSYLAQLVGENLLPEHQHLLAEPEQQ
jgi:hypothetical protein